MACLPLPEQWQKSLCFSGQRKWTTIIILYVKHIFLEIFKSVLSWTYIAWIITVPRQSWQVKAQRYVLKKKYVLLVTLRPFEFMIGGKYIEIMSQVKPSYVYENSYQCFITSQVLVSSRVVFVSMPKLYLWSGYFLISSEINEFQDLYLNIDGFDWAYSKAVPGHGVCIPHWSNKCHLVDQKMSSVVDLLSQVIIWHKLMLSNNLWDRIWPFLLVHKMLPSAPWLVRIA